ncbi:MAG: ribokinase [Spartobacteria bacterium]|nr:ribokinase [Spartobacteria bacterium]
MTKFCIAGSINMDIVTRMPRFPHPGETMHGLSFNTFPGGKGANQAVALSKLGADVTMIGKVGSDMYGRNYMEYFADMDMNCSGVEWEETTSTGTASISVAESGENNIVIVAGANGHVDSDFITRQSAIISSSDILLLQLEIPMESVLTAAEIAHKSGTMVILDPAPACPVPLELLQYVDLVTPNETEAEILSGMKINTPADMEEAGRKLLAQGAKTVIIKAGSRGAYVITPDSTEHIPGFTVTAIDTTAAGDSFNAGLAHALGEKHPLHAAVRFAHAVAAIATTKLGAQSAMPSMTEALHLMNASM